MAITVRDGKVVLIIDGEPRWPYDRRLRDLEVESDTDSEKSVLKKHGFRIFGLWPFHYVCAICSDVNEDRQAAMTRGIGIAVPADLTVHHLSVLAVLRSDPSASAAEIADAIDLDVDLVEDLLADLEESGLLRSAY